MSELAAVSHWAAGAAGGALGAILRCLLTRLAAEPPSRSLPHVDPALATLAANLIACTLLGGWGELSRSLARGSGVADGFSEALAAFLVIGLCGSLSTFSSLCADAVRLARPGSDSGPGSRSPARALGYLVAHFAGGPLALGLGAWLTG